MNTQTCGREPAIPVLADDIMSGSGIVEPASRPFILDFLVSYPGAMGPTTSGTWDNMDGSDCN